MNPSQIAFTFLALAMLAGLVGVWLAIRYVAGPDDVTKAPARPAGAADPRDRETQHMTASEVRATLERHRAEGSPLADALLASQARVDAMFERLGQPDQKRELLAAAHREIDYARTAERLVDASRPPAGVRGMYDGSNDRGWNAWRIGLELAASQILSPADAAPMAPEDMGHAIVSAFHRQGRELARLKAAHEPVADSDTADWLEGVSATFSRALGGDNDMAAGLYLASQELRTLRAFKRATEQKLLQVV